VCSSSLPTYMGKSDLLAGESSSLVKEGADESNDHSNSCNGPGQGGLRGNLFN